MEHSSEPNFSVLLVSSLEISDSGAYISTCSRGLTRPAGPVLVVIFELGMRFVNLQHLFQKRFYGYTMN